MTELKLDQVVKKYGKTEVVHGINLDIKDKEFLVLVGPSGCGKSTLLRMVAGLEVISEGTISIGGKVVNDLAPKDRGLAMVFQNYALYPHMNVFNNMSFGLKLNKTPKTEIQERVQEVAQILGLENLLDRKPHELSGGQRQRVAMGRAMVRKPSVFLFDEPLSNLDAKLRIQMRAEIKRLHHRVNATIIYVTHDQVEAMTLADRIVVLRDGYIEQVGTPMELFSQPANTFVAGFIGTPPMNLLPCKAAKKENDFVLLFEKGLEIPVPPREGGNITDGQNLVMGIRTEEIHPTEGTTLAPGEARFQGTVDVVEPLGNETHIHVDLKGVKFIARCESRLVVNHQDTIEITMNLNQMHIFDAKSTRVVY
ncbi:carbohydrate ABC transporter ATP-binding protein, CUT1 family [Desulfocicer vacuolatum DSM 3385]|uniref:Carbohydrate ABC transporter ATP-binding protein, CUT1 family n=1 Tax=Desulfocicer vacuolatum DSM 3385 TaxID=1121400 RepID=A0A1W2CQY1_9BACT|nr:sn-glycerol-3-phosphate ABC transporter ATP-binding protein UgpC [Desulfocicer vacuolatum]SMC87364.1 carbohydrate ABC transporter ATP-binding protein, CUT1 family [Desulfocicer vacuolatum DSM 3385]